MGTKPTFKIPLPVKPKSAQVALDDQGRWWMFGKGYSGEKGHWSQFVPLEDDELFYGSGEKLIDRKVYADKAGISQYSAIVDQEVDPGAPVILCVCGEVEFQIKYGDYQCIAVCRNGHENTVYDG